MEKPTVEFENSEKRQEFMNDKDSETDDAEADAKEKLSGDKRKRGSVSTEVVREVIRLSILEKKRNRYIAEQLNLPASTVSGIIRRFLRDGQTEPKRRGHRPSRYNPEHRSFLLDQVNREPMITLQVLKERFKTMFPRVPISVGSIHRMLQRCAFSLRLVKTNVDLGELSEQRNRYINTLVNANINLARVIYIGEVGFALRMRKHKVRSSQSPPNTEEVSANISVLAAIGYFGFLSVKPVLGSFSSSQIMAFLHNLTVQAVPESYTVDEIPQITIILQDTVQLRSPRVTEVLDAYGIVYFYIPCGSEYLNPIEMAFSKIEFHAQASSFDNKEEVLQATLNLFGYISSEDVNSYFNRVNDVFSSRNKYNPSMRCTTDSLYSNTCMISAPHQTQLQSPPLSTNAMEETISMPTAHRSPAISLYPSILNDPSKSIMLSSAFLSTDVNAELENQSKSRKLSH